MAQSVAIVGAGIGGLTAAYRLMNAGIKSVIFEASHRVGGRILTRQFDDNTKYELGAEFIDSNHLDIIDLIRELGLELVDIGQRQDSNTKYFVIDYDIPSNPICEYIKTDIFADYQKIFPLVLADRLACWPDEDYNPSNPSVIKFNDIDMATYIDDLCQCLRSDKNGSISKMAQLLKMVYLSETGVEVNLQSSLNLILMMGFSDYHQPNWFGLSNEMFKLKNGTGSLIDKLTKILSESNLCDIRLNTPIVKIKKIDNQYQLTTSSNTTHDYQFIIMTIPFQVYDQIDYAEAQFDVIKQQVIQTAKLGCCTKFAVQFREKFWDTESFYMTNQHQSMFVYQPDKTKPFLIFYLAGNRAKTIDSVTELFDELKKIYPKFDQSSIIINMDTFDWTNCEWCRGAYSTYLTGQYTTIVGKEYDWSNNCSFVGENCDIEFQGYMNGAVLTANAATDRIISICQKNGN